MLFNLRTNEVSLIYNPSPEIQVQSTETFVAIIGPNGTKGAAHRDIIKYPCEVLHIKEKSIFVLQQLLNH